MTKEERLQHCLDWIRKIKADNDTFISDQVEAEKYYFARALGNEVQGRSQIVTTDLFDTIEWIMPSLMRIFASDNDVCSLKPRGPEDAKVVELNQELANYQLRVRNKWFIAIHDWFKDALLHKIGVIKYSWERETVEVKKEYQGLAIQQVQAKLLEPNVELVSAEQDVNGLWNIVVMHTIHDAYPRIEAVPPHEVGFPKTQRTADDIPFFYHRVKLYPYQIAKRYGKDRVEQIKEKVNFLSNASVSATGDEDSVEDQRFEDLGGVNFILDTEDSKYWVYECYFIDPETGDSRKLVLSGDVVCEDGENEYDRPPFHIITPIKLSHRLIGRSFFDILKDLQRLRTALVRQVLDNIYFSNSGRYIGDPDRVNFDDLLNNNVPGGYVRGDPSAIKDLTPPQLQPWTFKLLEYVQSEKENRTGVTRYNQGLDAKSLNRTARGLTAILSQSQQRIELIARIFAEMGIAPLINSVLDMNIKFLDSAIPIQVLNEWIDFDPDNILTKRDVIVNVGIGMTDKDTIIAQMQQLLGIYAQIYQLGLPIITPMNIYNACKELTKAMGYRNTDAFWTKPPEQGGMAFPGMLPGMLQGMAPGEAQPTGVGTFPGQKTPELPEQPAQPMQPRTTIDGGGFYG